MAKSFSDIYRQLREGVLPDLKKPGIGPGSGQHSVGNMSVQSKPLAQAVADTSSYKAQAEINRPKLNPAPAAQKPTSNIQTSVMDKAVAAKTAVDTAARGNAIRRPAPAPKPSAQSGAPQMASGTKLNRPTGWNPMTGTGKAPATAPANPMMGEKKPTTFAPGMAANRTKLAAQAKANRVGGSPSPVKVRPGEKVPGDKPATNAQLTGQAMALKGFGKTSGGGNYKAAQTPIAPKLDPTRNAALDNPTTQSPMARATNPNVGGAGGVGSSLGKQSGSGTTVAKPGQAQASVPPAKTAPTPASKAAPAKAKPVARVKQKVQAQKPAAKPVAPTKRSKLQSRFQRDSLAMDSRRLSEMVKELREKKINELHAPYETPHKSTLGAMEVRQARHEKQGNQERKPTDYKATNEKKEVAVKKNQTVINTEPENNSPIAGY